MAVKQATDSFGRPLLLEEGWYFKGHRSRSNAEKDELARAALEREGKEWVQKAINDGVRITFHHVDLTENANQGSDTSQSWDGRRKHKCWGTARGHVYYEE